MNRFRILLGLAAGALLAAGSALHAQTQPVVGKVDVKTGDLVSVEATSRADPFREPQDRNPYPRTFAQQPPLIPHGIEGFEVTAASNACMDCHNQPRATEPGAAKVSPSHFRDRDGRQLPTVSAGRYFCLQCHVPQIDAPLLVGNTFKPSPQKTQPRAK